MLLIKRWWGEKWGEKWGEISDWWRMETSVVFVKVEASSCSASFQFPPGQQETFQLAIATGSVFSSEYAEKEIGVFDQKRLRYCSNTNNLLRL